MAARPGRRRFRHHNAGRASADDFGAANVEGDPTYQEVSDTAKTG